MRNGIPGYVIDMDMEEGQSLQYLTKWSYEDEE